MNLDVRKDLMRETNRWVLFLIHALFDSRRNLTEKEMCSRLNEYRKLIKNTVGVAKISKKANIYNSILLYILKSNILSDNVKISLLNKMIYI